MLNNPSREGYTPRLATPPTEPGLLTRAQDQRQRNLHMLDRLADHCLSVLRMVDTQTNQRYAPAAEDIHAHSRAARGLRRIVALTVSVAEAEHYDAERRDAALDALDICTELGMQAIARFTSALGRGGATAQDLHAHARGVQSLTYTIALKTRLLADPTEAARAAAITAARAQARLDRRLQVADLVAAQIAAQQPTHPEPHPEPQAEHWATQRQADRDERLASEDYADFLETHSILGLTLRLCRELGITPDLAAWPAEAIAQAEQEAAQPTPSPLPSWEGPGEGAEPQTPSPLPSWEGQGEGEGARAGCQTTHPPPPS